MKYWKAIFDENNHFHLNMLSIYNLFATNEGIQIVIILHNLAWTSKSNGNPDVELSTLLVLFNCRNKHIHMFWYIFV